jgi:hypothetical protein
VTGHSQSWWVRRTTAGLIPAAHAETDQHHEYVQVEELGYWMPARDIQATVLRMLPGRVGGMGMAPPAGPPVAATDGVTSCNTAPASPAPSVADDAVVIAIVATKDRPELLCTRCLPSMFAQTRAPAVVLIVQDYAVRVLQRCSICSQAK